LNSDFMLYPFPVDSPPALDTWLELAALAKVHVGFVFDGLARVAWHPFFFFFPSPLLIPLTWLLTTTGDSRWFFPLWTQRRLFPVPFFFPGRSPCVLALRFLCGECERFFPWEVQTLSPPFPNFFPQGSQFTPNTPPPLFSLVSRPPPSPLPSSVFVFLVVDPPTRGNNDFEYMCDPTLGLAWHALLNH